MADLELADQSGEDQSGAPPPIADVPQSSGPPGNPTGMGPIPPQLAQALETAQDPGDSALPSSKDIMGLMQQNDVEGRGLLAGKKAATDKLLQQMEAGGKDIAGVPVPQMERQPKAPKQQMGQGIGEFMQIAAIIGALGGGLARRNTTAALNAFAGGMKGFAQGNHEAFERGMEEFKAESQRVKDDNQAKLDQYNLIISNKKFTMDQKLGQLKIAAAEYDDAIKYNLAERKDYNSLLLAIDREKQFMMTYGLRQQDLVRKAEETHARVTGMLGSRGVDGMLLNMKRQEYMDQHGGQQPPANLMQTWRAQITASSSAARTKGNRAGNLQVIVDSMPSAIQNALNASKAIPKSNWRAYNVAELKLLEQKGSPELKRFATANLQVSEEWARAMNPTGVLREDLQNRALSILNIADGPKAYAAALQQVYANVKTVQTGVNKALAEGNAEIADAPGEDILEYELGEASGLGSKPGAASAPAGKKGDQVFDFKNGKFVPVQ